MQSKYTKTNMVCRFKLVRLIVNLSFLCFQKENGQLTSGIQSRTGVHGSNPTSQRSQEVPHDEVQRLPQHRHLQMEPGQHLLKQSFIFLSNLLHQKEFSLIFRNINSAKKCSNNNQFFRFGWFARTTDASLFARKKSSRNSAPDPNSDEKRRRKQGERSTESIPENTTRTINPGNFSFSSLFTQSL